MEAEAFKGHYFLSYKGKGHVKQLGGKNIFIIFFVSDSVSRWTETAEKEFLNAFHAAANALRSQAALYHVSLEPWHAVSRFSVTKNCGISNASQWREDLAASLHMPSITAYQAWYQGKHSCDFVPILFAFNKPERSFAYEASVEHPSSDEYSAIFRSPENKFSPRSIMHEILHQCGAKDLYYPEEVRRLAEKHLPGSIMNIGTEQDIAIDDLTAYTVGLCDTLSPRAASFLKATRHIDKKTVSDARQRSIDGKKPQ